MRRLEKIFLQDFNIIFQSLTKIKMSTVEKRLSVFTFETENPGSAGDGQKSVKKQRKMKLPKDPEAPKRPLRLIYFKVGASTKPMTMILTYLIRKYLFNIDHEHLNIFGGWNFCVQYPLS